VREKGPLGDSAQPPGHAHQSPVPILLVDDNPAKLLAVTAALAPLGHRIVSADSGLAALRRVTAENFAVILMDVQMPIMDGFETAALIRMRRQSETTPIIFITARASDEIVSSQRYSQGAVDFITAPVQPDVLRAKVAAFANLFLRAQELAAEAQRVQASADQLRLLTESAPIGIFQTDADNRYIYTNPRWSEITGLASTAALGQQWDVIIDEEQRVSLATTSDDKGLGRDEFSHRFRFDLRVPGAPDRVALVTSKVMHDTDSQVVGWVGTLMDITTEARAEAALSRARDDAARASQLKSDFLANMSHEIRTPMNAVIGMADLLIDTNLDAQQRELIDTVRSSGDALMAVINDILDFSKIESGELELDSVSFDLRDEIENCLDLVVTAARAKGLELAFKVDEDCPQRLTGDVVRLRQIVANLLSNAVKFTERGEVLVTVGSTAAGPGGGRCVGINVIDTGIGIRSDGLGELFTSFSQVDTSTTRVYGGTGLGLAISRRLAQAMGGDVTVVSTPGAGSTFTATVVLDVAPDLTGADEAVTTPALEGKAILLVDDNPTVLRILSDQVTKLGMVSTTAEDAFTALRLVREGLHYDIAVLDMFMASMTGVELGAALRGLPNVNGAPHILLTSLGSRPIDVDESFAAFVSKPVKRAALKDALVAAMTGGVATASSPLAPVIMGADEKPLRLLLAEDNPINQRVEQLILAKLGQRVDIVANGLEALEAVKSGHYDVVLMDLQMPVMGGLEATRRIRALPELDQPYIVAMTAGVQPSDREACMSAGMDSYLSKPVRKAEIQDLLAEISPKLRLPVRAR
jgi:PAS domain S-box-containing protein